MADHTILGRSLTPTEKTTILQFAADGETENLQNLLEELANTHCRTVGQLVLEATDHVGLGIIHKAAENDQRSVIKMICDDLGFQPGVRLAVLNAQEQGGRTAASIAAQKNHHEFLRDLILRGANMLITDWMHSVPLHRAAMQKCTLAMHTLIELVPHHGGVNIQTVSGQTPLHMSLAVGDIMRAGYLICARTDVNLQTVAGDSALHQSIPLWTEGNDDPEFNAMMLSHFRRLFAAGANPMLYNGAGKLPRDIARDLGHHKAASCIIAQGG